MSFLPTKFSTGFFPMVSLLIFPVLQALELQRERRRNVADVAEGRQERAAVDGHAPWRRSLVLHGVDYY